MLSLVVFGAVVLRDDVDAGLVGIAVVYSIGLSGMFQYMVRQTAQVEVMMTSAERIAHYTHIEPEQGMLGPGPAGRACPNPWRPRERPTLPRKRKLTKLKGPVWSLLKAPL